MTAITNSQRLRLAVGIFRDDGTLQIALKALRGDGFAEDGLAIVAGRETLVRFGWSCGGPAMCEEGDPEIRGFTEIGVSGAAGPLLASDGQIARLLVGWAYGAGRRAGCLLDPWLDRVHARVLQRDLDDGAATLWVRIDDSDEELRACRILLRTSADRVQVHDIAEDQPRGDPFATAV